MGGEGSMMAANQSLKNNRAQLKRKGKGALEGSYAGIELKEFPEASEEQILEIREKIQQENRRSRIRQLVFLVIFITAILLLFLIF
ncbi:MAG: hypothetical protein ACON5F_14850 [Jejuia sp.]